MISCDQKVSEQASPNSLNPVDLIITDDKNILGSWSMCSTVSGGLVMQYNDRVCPVVSFNSDGSGSVDVKEIFNWRFSKGTLTINYLPQYSNSTFADGNYTGVITRKGDGLQLLVREVKSGAKFYLSK